MVTDLSSVAGTVPDLTPGERRPRRVDSESRSQTEGSLRKLPLLSTIVIAVRFCSTRG
jgi:hypothetical protein